MRGLAVLLLALIAATLLWGPDSVKRAGSRVIEEPKPRPVTPTHYGPYQCWKLDSLGRAIKGSDTTEGEPLSSNPPNHVWTWMCM